MISYKDYPNIVIEILKYFDINNGVNRTPIGFVEENYSKSVGSSKIFTIQPSDIVQICEKLFSKQMISKKENNSIDGITNIYLAVLKKGYAMPTISNLIYYNTIVFGFSYLYDVMKKLVKPIVYYYKDENNKEKTSIGTCIEFNKGILTCKHCIIGADKVSIQGYKAQELNNKAYLISNNENVDLIFIPDVNNSDYHLLNQGKILDDIVVLGFPSIPGLQNVLTIEKASISGDDYVVKGSRGSIVANANNYLQKMELHLISAKIKGGNSGGPIINSNGELIGITSSKPDYNGENYDDLGYGFGIPYKYIIDLLNGNNTCTLSFSNHYFIDFVE